jgi:hypothetical protein
MTERRKDHTPTQDRGPKKQSHDTCEEIIAEAMVATGNTRKRRARFDQTLSQGRR